MNQNRKILGVMACREVREALEAERTRTGRSLSALAERVLADWLRERGYDVPAEALRTPGPQVREQRELEVA